jgi:5-methylcytosine-specific restriction endonuclease McrA
VTIPNSIQEFVRNRANFQCEYCHYPEFLSTSPLTIDHIKPQSLGGSDDVDNLASACRRCNERHYNFKESAEGRRVFTITMQLAIYTNYLSQHQ